MLKCLFLRKKLYDYIDNSLSDIDKIKVGAHLDVCANCRERINQIRNILDLAGQKEVPRPSDEFWHNFKIDLDRQLNKKLIPQLKPGYRPSYSFRPAFAYVLTLVFAMLFGSFFLKNYSSVRTHSITQDSLADEVVDIDEVSQESMFDNDKDSYIDEIELLSQFEQNPS